MVQHPKQVIENIKEYYESIVMYPLNVLEFKEKRKTEFENASQKWDRGFNMMPLVNQINCSYLLGCNEYIVKPFVTECAHILACIDDYESKNKQQSKGCPEVSAYYADIFKKVDKSQFVSWMMTDLEYWSEKYSFEINKADVIEMFKKEKSHYLALLAKK